MRSRPRDLAADSENRLQSARGRARARRRRGWRSRGAREPTSSASSARRSTERRSLALRKCLEADSRRSKALESERNRRSRRPGRSATARLSVFVPCDHGVAAPALTPAPAHVAMDKPRREHRRAGACSAAASTRQTRTCAWSPTRWRDVRVAGERSDRAAAAAGPQVGQAAPRYSVGTRVCRSSWQVGAAGATNCSRRTRRALRHYTAQRASRPYSTVGSPKSDLG